MWKIVLRFVNLDSENVTGSDERGRARRKKEAE